MNTFIVTFEKLSRRDLVQQQVVSIYSYSKDRIYLKCKGYTHDVLCDDRTAPYRNHYERPLFLIEDKNQYTFLQL